CILARQDDRFGEVPFARVVLGPGTAVSEAALLDLCRTRLAGFKLPQEIEFVDSLPRTASGKLLHRER
ncbi:MAG: AMP-binding enzyme, partial [Planctomycetaceae bacterium]